MSKKQDISLEKHRIWAPVVKSLGRGMFTFGGVLVTAVYNLEIKNLINIDANGWLGGIAGSLLLIAILQGIIIWTKNGTIAKRDAEIRKLQGAA